MVAKPENTNGGAAIKTFIAKIWALLNGYYFSKATVKIVHFNPLTTMFPICFANQWTGFYMRGILVVKGLKVKSVMHVCYFLQWRYVKRERIVKEYFS